MRHEPANSLTRAAELFEAWRQRAERGSGEPYEEFLAAHVELRDELDSMRRAEDALVAFRPPGPPGPPNGPAAPGDSAPGRRSNGGHLAPGDELGDFRIVRELGRGGMGIVFEAEQISLHRRVALKILPAQLTLNRQALERFRREAEITGRLKHRGIVDIHQVGEHDGIHYIVMELVDGISLDRVVDRMRGESLEQVRKLRIADVVSAHGLEDVEAKPPSGEQGSKTRKTSSSASNKNYIESSVRLICQVADALDHAHKASVIHRDIKPANILVRGDGTPVLTDFGLARESGLPGITVTGAFAGTPNYLSPEQAMSGRVPVDHRSDVFSLGATLYELVTLHYAFEGNSLHEVLSRILSKPPIPPQKHNPALAPDLVTILEKALEKDPDRRYQSAGELAEDLRAFIEYRPIRAKRTATVVRALRWVRREPLKALLGIVLALGVPGGLGLWTSAVRAWRESEESRGRLLDAELPEKLGTAFLQVGVGELAEAERTFGEALAQDADSQEAAAGLAMTLLAQKEYSEARGVIERFEAAHPHALGRLRAEALRALGDKSAADEIEASLPEPRTPSDKYLEGVRLICGHPFVAGLPADSLRPLLGAKVSSVSLREGRSKDVLVEYRANAREAIELLSAAAADEHRAIYHFALAWAAWLGEDEVTAQRYSESILRKWPENTVARFYATLAHEVYDEQGALDEYSRLLESDSHLWMAHQRRAVLFFERGESALALAEIRAVVDIDPERVTSRVNLATLLLNDGQLDEAARVAREVLEEDRGIAELHDVLGLVQYAQHDAKGARECFERAVALDDKRASYENHLGFVLLQSDGARALEHLERARTLDPGDPFVAYNMGLAYGNAGEHEAALEALEHALELVEDDPNPRLPVHLVFGARGQELVELGRPEEAVDSVREAIRREPDFAGHYAVLGRAAEDAGRIDECLDARERLLQMTVDQDDNHDALIAALKKKGYMTRAFAAAVRWTEAHSASPRAWNERAWLQCDPDIDPPLGDVQDALRCAEQALELDPDRYGYLDTLACAQFANGQLDAAIANASRAFDLAAGSGASAEALDAIEGHLIRFDASSPPARPVLAPGEVR